MLLFAQGDRFWSIKTVVDALTVLGLSFGLVQRWVTTGETGDWQRQRSSRFGVARNAVLGEPGA